ncbi:MAG TPA: signal peptidase I [Thermoanaerobaculia bacterium]|nr:signal peptidase I [Thermoanaerobaculia bacterium]
MAERAERSVFREYFEAILIAAIFLRFTNVFVVQTFYIPSGSMEDTLLIGDHLFVNRFIYGPAATELERRLLPLREVQRGDIVIFRSKTDHGMDIVKRAIGVPGDTIQVDNGELYLNGKDVADESYAIHKRPDPPFAPRDWFGPVTVPERRYFFMGDNRDESLDSRFWGFLPAHLVKGRALFIYWSNGNQPPEGTNPIAGLLRTALGFFSNTRWDRSFRLIR